MKKKIATKACTSSLKGRIISATEYAMFLRPDGKGNSTVDRAGLRRYCRNTKCKETKEE